MSQDADAREQFTQELLELHRHAGSPSIEKIVSLCTTRMPAQGTVHNLLTGRGTKAPDWDVVSDVVRAMIKYARQKGRDLGDYETDVDGWWKHRHTELEHALEQAGRDRVSQKKRTLAELGQLVKVHRKSGALPTLGDVLNGDFTDWPGFPGLASRAYASRPAFDDDIRAALDSAAEPWPFILVYGNKRSGKSTSAWRAAESYVDPVTVLLVPRNGQALAAIAHLNGLAKAVGAPILIWADALSSDDMNQLTQEITDRLSEIGIVIGTISADSVDEILKDDSRRDLTIARAAFIRAQRVHLPYDRVIVAEPENEDVDPPASGDINMMQVRST